jgi:uncharacterized lipoprotein YddW (UPF0748 family)
LSVKTLNKQIHLAIKRLAAWVAWVLVLTPGCKAKLNTPISVPLPPAGAGSQVPGPLSPPLSPSQKLTAYREVRGVWLTNVDSTVLNTKESLESSLALLAKLGFTTVYPVVWNKGYTLYPSPVTQRTYGASVMPEPAFSSGGRDMLQECIDAAKKHGLEVIPWFEWGLKIPATHPLTQQKPEWITQNQAGQKSRLDGIYVSYLNPSNPAVGSFLKDLVVDLVRRYDVDGIQFDDHFSMWHEFGYDDLTLKGFSGGIKPTGILSSRDVLWQEFRAGRITSLLADIVRAARATRPGLVISLSSNKFPWSLKEHLQNWPDWIKRGLADEFVLQNYLEDFSDFSSDLAGYRTTDTGHVPKPYTVMGLLSGIKGRRVTVAELERRISATRQSGYGMAFFFYGSLFDLIPPGETASQREAMLARQFARPSYPRQPPP